MDQQSQQKVLNAGFIIIRKDDQPTPRIKQKTPFQHEWHTLSKYPTKAERDRAFDYFMKDAIYIND